MPFHTPAEQAKKNRPFESTSFLDELRGDTPQAARQATRAFAPRQGLNFPGQGRGFFNFFQSRPDLLEEEFQARQAQLSAQGLPPNLDRLDFFGDFDFINRFLRATPQDRGIQNARFAPPARWLIPR